MCSLTLKTLSPLKTGPQTYMKTSSLLIKSSSTIKSATFSIFEFIGFAFVKFKVTGKSKINENKITLNKLLILVLRN